MIADPDDDAVRAAALGGRADLIVSGDAHLLNLKHFHHSHIITTDDTGVHARVEQRGIGGRRGLKNSRRNGALYSELASLRGHLSIARIARAISVPPAIESGATALR